MTEQADEAPKQDMICGRKVTVQQPVKPAYGAHRKTRFKANGQVSAQTPRARFVVEGITHKNGQPIRFKSRDNAERHILNMGLAK